VFAGKMEYEATVTSLLHHLSPQIQKGASVYELGCGVGAALVVARANMGAGPVGGTDFSPNAINHIKTVFPEDAANFTVGDITVQNSGVPDASYDHVISIGAAGMYLDLAGMKRALQEAVRILKPGGSLLISHLLEPRAEPRRSIVCPVPKETWLDRKWQHRLGITNMRIAKIPGVGQGDRYYISMTKRERR
jgi:ubiquinone/menaquinone biosynthesis C-methylase UbiE